MAAASANPERGEGKGKERKGETERERKRAPDSTDKMAAAILCNVGTEGTSYHLGRILLEVSHQFHSPFKGGDYTRVVNTRRWGPSGTLLVYLL